MATPVGILLDADILDGALVGQTAGNRSVILSALRARGVCLPLKNTQGFGEVRQTEKNLVVVSNSVSVIVTAAGMAGSPKTYLVPVAQGDTASAVAAKIRTALAADPVLTALYTVSGAGANIVLTRTTLAANDATMNVAIANGTCAGLTAAPTSVNTTAGSAGVTAQVETATVAGTITSPAGGTVTAIVTAAGLVGSPRTVTATLTAADTSVTAASKIAAALNLDANVAAFCTVEANNGRLIIRPNATVPNDPTLNLSINNGTFTGLTPSLNSTDVTGGCYMPGKSAVDLEAALLVAEPVGQTLANAAHALYVV